jgi:hypothetical protein
MNRTTMRYRLVMGACGVVLAMASSGLASTGRVEDPINWSIGPDVRGVNYSVGMLLKPTPVRPRGWSFVFPYPDREAGHVHAVTYNSGPLINASKIVMRYRIDSAPAAQFVPQEGTGERATVSLYFQRRGDNWSGRRRFEFYRWYVPAASVRELARGEYSITVNLADPGWTSVMGRPAANHMAAFRDALAETSQIGIAFGSPNRRAHGVYSTGPARFTLIEFRIS